MAPHLAAQQARGSRRLSLVVGGPEKRDTDMLLNRTDVDFGAGVTLTNILSYTRERANRSGDLDGTILPIADSLGITGHGDGANPDHSILTEELQLTGAAIEGSLDWRIGGYFERLRTEGAQTFSQRLFLGQTTHQLDAPQSVDSEAVFGHVNLELGSISESLERFDLSAGYRLYPGRQRHRFRSARIPRPALRNRSDSSTDAR